jgi:hypothetical protein
MDYIAASLPRKRELVAKTSMALPLFAILSDPNIADNKLTIGIMYTNLA